METIRCFLIDDDVDDWEFFQLALGKVDRPSVLACAVSCESGLQMLHEMEDIPHYIFLDLNMGLTSGVECLAFIRNDPRLASVPVIIVSSSENPTYDEKLRELNARHFLVKPIRNSALASIITSIFDRKELPYLLIERNSELQMDDSSV